MKPTPSQPEKIANPLDEVLAPSPYKQTEREIYYVDSKNELVQISSN